MSGVMHRTNSEGGASSTASSQRWRISSALRKFGSISGSSKDDKNATVCFAFRLTQALLCIDQYRHLRFLSASISAPSVCLFHLLRRRFEHLDCFLFLLLPKPSLC